MFERKRLWFAGSLLLWSIFILTTPYFYVATASGQSVGFSLITMATTPVNAAFEYMFAGIMFGTFFVFIPWFVALIISYAKPQPSVQVVDLIWWFIRCFGACGAALATYMLYSINGMVGSGFSYGFGLYLLWAVVVPVWWRYLKSRFNSGGTKPSRPG